MSEIAKRVAKAMQDRASQPLANLSSLEPVLVGSLGDAWECLAIAAVETMREAEMSEEIQGWKPPVIYDIVNDRTRIATQADIDQLTAVSDAYARLCAIHANAGEIMEMLRRGKLGRGS